MKAGLVAVILGFALIAIGMVMSSNLQAGTTKTEFGGFVLLGPIPIAFGTSEGSMLMAIGMGVMMLITVWAITAIVRRR
ncbi:MAG: hypothetical protein AEth_00015 [Candidatus Argoarchaeum ethanivorans]|uniref:TIGR00304 family protein n=1 Tax=Candidatus Argoarchaeum ethanivorans TaxID=2608793 RepID=A0A8B3S826_9EURY|nr:MAG: hypothetical protein AEth_00015 [Candidatus Argoarchaeum ethanivorans]